MEDVLKKVKKLLALSQSSNPNEAALAAARAQELMDEHKLSMADIDAVQLGITDPMDESWIQESIGEFTYMEWKGALLHGIAKLNNVQDFLYNKGARLKLIGRQTDRQIVEYLACYLIREVERLAFEDYRNAGFRDNKQRWNWVKNFGMGAASTILRRMREEKQRFATANSAMTAVVKRDDTALTSYLAAKYPRSKREGNCTVNYSNAEAKSNGRQAGERITWSQGVGSGAGQKQIA